jgi:hypothetical protein
MLAALIVYQPFALLFGLFGGIRALFVRENAGFEPVGTAPGSNGYLDESKPDEPGWNVFYPRLAGFLLLWTWIGLVLALIYPSHQVSDLIWVLVPIWALAGLELQRFLPEGELQPVSIGQAALVFVLLALFWYTLAALSNVLGAPGAGGARLAVLAGILVLAALTTLLVSLGWSWSIAQRGLVWGMTAAAAIYLFATTIGASQLRPNQPQELWAASPAPGEVELLRATVDDLAEWQTGDSRFAEILVTSQAPSLRWALHDIHSVRFVDQLPSGEQTPIVITLQQQAEPQLTAAYRGQDFVWWIRPGWVGPLPPNLARWLIFREAPLEKEHLIVWARSDIFPGDETVQSNNPAGQP